MRFWWQRRQERTDRDSLSYSRPRVAQAIQRASEAQAARSSLGSASVDAVSLHYMQAVERAAASGPLTKQARRRERGLPPELLWQTARVARQAGRQPEEIWAEALSTWLTFHAPEGEATGVPRTVGGRRQATWHEIDKTLRSLRVS